MPDPPASISQVLKLQACTNIPACIWCWGSNLCPCQGSTLPAGPHLQPRAIHFLKVGFPHCKEGQWYPCAVILILQGLKKSLQCSQPKCQSLKSSNKYTVNEWQLSNCSSEAMPVTSGSLPRSQFPAIDSSYGSLWSLLPTSHSTHTPHLVPSEQNVRFYDFGSPPLQGGFNDTVFQDLHSIFQVQRKTCCG